MAKRNAGRSGSKKENSSRNGRRSGSKKQKREDYPDYEIVDPNDIDEGPDVMLDVPVVKVDEIDILVEDLRAAVSVRAELQDLVQLNVGVAARLGKVELNIQGVEAQALLKARLDNVSVILGRVLTTLDRNPKLLESVGKAVEHVGGGARGTLEGAGEAVEDVGEGAGETLPEVGKGAGQAVGDIGEGAGQAVGDIGRGANQAVGQLGEGAGQAVQGVGQGAGQAVQGVGQGAGQAVQGVGQGARGLTEDLSGQGQGGEQPQQQQQQQQQQKRGQGGG
jgi:hypothetical protein